MRTTTLSWINIALLSACAATDAASQTVSNASASPDVDSGPMSASANNAGGSNGSATGSASLGSSGVAEPALPPCESGANEDRDQDGITAMEGDCYDCDARVNPGAFDVLDNGIDDDCSGSQATGKDDDCDHGLALTSFDAKDGARAIGLCSFSSPQEKRWGVLRAAYVSADGSRALSTASNEDEHVGLLPSFGPEQPRAGASLLALSSGVARAPGQTGFDASRHCGAYYTSGLDAWPKNYPRPSPACGTGSGGGALLHDPAALELDIRVPTNAKGLSFDTSFYTYEYPDFICSRYNDYFLVLMMPAPTGTFDENLVFDAEGNWVSVNNGLLQMCTPGTHQGKTFKCPLGTSRLAGTGYGANDSACGEGASTGWLNTVVPVTPGSQIKLRFTIWDTGDPNRDSTALIDHFRWDLDAPTAVKTTVL